MSTTVSSLSVVIGADVSGFTRGATSVQSKITTFGTTAAGAMVATGRAMTAFGDSVSSTGSRISDLSQPFTDMAMAGLEAASGFEDVMTQLSVMGGLTGDELEVVRQKALQLGADTKFSAADAASGMLELVKSGMSVSDAMTAMQGTMDLAAAGTISLEMASGIVTTTLAQFGLSADQAGLAADVLAAAALASRADVDTLGQGLSNVGPVAAAAGLSLEDTAASLAVLSNAGISGAEAGTQLKSLLLAFNTPVAKAAFNTLGVSLYDAAGNTRDFGTVLEELKVALDGLTPEQRATAMKNLAGSYGVTSLNALLAAGGIDEMKTTMDAAPAASELASRGMGTFSGKVDSLRGSVETLMITGLTPLMENVLTPLADKVTGVVNSFTEWAEQNPETASTIGGIALALGVLGPALVIIGSGVSLLGMAFSGLGAIVGIIASPIVLLGGAIALLVAVVTNPDIQEGLKAWEGIFTNIETIISTMTESIMTRLAAFVGGVKNFVIDFETTVLQLQVIGAQALIDMGQGANLLGIDVAAQTAIRDSAIAQIDVLGSQRYVPGAPGSGVPHFAGGGMMSSTGLAYLHAGERVLNPAQTAAYDSGRSGGSSVLINVYGAQDLDSLVNEIQRRGGPNILKSESG